MNTSFVVWKRTETTNKYHSFIFCLLIVSQYSVSQQQCHLLQVLVEPVLVRLVGESVGDDALAFMFPQAKHQLGTGSDFTANYENALK